ncbi:hypothetical protein CQA63_01565 [Helicobacter marmotae]|uniref:Uncharacterized protein n=1 Tax=Helicobacter marmotae TaxID=152490 RepID=A0A3D8I835_9HELI|nr:hypothetical protein CQA63_01565 [Helicobacter marmotae]
MRGFEREEFPLELLEVLLEILRLLPLPLEEINLATRKVNYFLASRTPARGEELLFGFLVNAIILSF